MAPPPRPARSAPTSKDVAALAGVAQSTVSAVMSGNRAVSATTRRRVEQAMRELRYQPNAGARTLRTARTNVIALVVHLDAQADASETVPYLDAILEQARKIDYDVVISTMREGPAGIQRLAGRAICDGIILMDVTMDDDRIAAAAELDVPVMLMGRPEDARGLDVVDFDSRRSAELLVDELAATGHRHIALVGEPGDQAEKFQFMIDFHEGARARAARRGIDLDVVRRPGEGWEGMVDCAEHLLFRRDDRLGLITRTARTTEWTVRLLHQHGLVPGHDVSLVSLCTDHTATGFPHPISNVSPQPAAASNLAVQLLAERLAGTDAPPARRVLVQPEGIVRRSTTTRFDQRN